MCIRDRSVRSDVRTGSAYLVPTVGTVYQIVWYERAFALFLSSGFVYSIGFESFLHNTPIFHKPGVYRRRIRAGAKS